MHVVMSYPAPLFQTLVVLGGCAERVWPHETKGIYFKQHIICVLSTGFALRFQISQQANFTSIETRIEALGKILN